MPSLLTREEARQNIKDWVCEAEGKERLRREQLVHEELYFAASAGEMELWLYQQKYPINKDTK